MTHVAIVEDDFESRKTIEEYLRVFEEESGNKFEITTFEDGYDILRDYKANYQIIFLDVQMKKLDGLETARRIREMDLDVIIIFITNMVQHALQGYKVDALSYLVKPVPAFAFMEEMKRAMEKLGNKKNKYLLIPMDNGFIRVNVADVLYIENVKHRLTIYTKDEEYSVVDTMKNMEDSLAEYFFYRCNNGYLVNLAHVTAIEDVFAVVGGHRVQISRPRKKDFLAALTDYVGGV